jgi:hypothetical protein
MSDQHPIHARYAEALASGEPAVIPAGRDVLCDFCDEDLTADTRSGGFMFGSKAVGPCCAEKSEASIKGYGEEWNIRDRCPAAISFADWVRGMRGPDAAITITPGLPGTWRP